MFTIECIPGINEAHCFRFDREEDAIKVAREMAEKHKVQVNVSKVIKRFLITVVEEDV